MFVDRIDAGRQLAERLLHLKGEDVVVLGLPRGGVPVAFEVASALGAPLDVIVVRKLGVPYQPELGMGAIGEDGARIINPDVTRVAAVSESDLAAVEERERAELQRRAKRFRGERTRVPLEGRTAVVIDDGIATGSTARAACQVARAHGAARVVLAVPVAPPGWATRAGDAADEYVCLETPRSFFAISQFYRDFTQTTDEEVIECLDRAAPPVARPQDRSNNRSAPPWRDREVEAAREEANGVELFEDAFDDEATVAAREEAQGVAVFDDPDAVIPASALREGAPGHETLTAEQAGFGRDVSEPEEGPEEEPYAEY